MAPPSFGPPGYSIPQRYRERTPPPEGADTNTRPYLIFFTFISTCFGVSAFVIRKILKKHAVLKNTSNVGLPPRKNIWLFSILAAGSLFTTWTFMIQYFNISYKTWLMWRSYYELDLHHRHWGLWLRETSLFHEAWELAVVGNSRYWWSHQAFFFALSLGLYLEQQGIRRGIKYTWAFMFLGQFVAVSFATNLFLLTLLLSPPESPKGSSTSVQRPSWFVPWLMNLGTVFATAIPVFLLTDDHYWHHSEDFLPVLLIPHVALFVLPTVRALLPGKYIPENSPTFNDKVYGYMWVLTLANAALMMVKTTYAAWAYSGFQGIQNALLEHPVVSSVGFDVIFCWVTWICWHLTEHRDAAASKHTEVQAKETYTDDGDGFAVTSSGYDGGVRRR